MNEVKAIIGRGGRLNIPSEHRKALGLSEGDEVLVGVSEGAIRIQTREAAIDRVQYMLRDRLGEGLSPSDELIEDRREQARREDEEFGDG